MIVTLGIWISGSVLVDLF